MYLIISRKYIKRKKRLSEKNLLTNKRNINFNNKYSINCLPFY